MVVLQWWQRNYGTPEAFEREERVSSGGVQYEVGVLVGSDYNSDGDVCEDSARPGVYTDKVIAPNTNKHIGDK